MHGAKYPPHWWSIGGDAGKGLCSQPARPDLREAQHCNSGPHLSAAPLAFFSCTLHAFPPPCSPSTFRVFTQDAGLALEAGSGCGQTCDPSRSFADNVPLFAGAFSRFPYRLCTRVWVRKAHRAAPRRLRGPGMPAWATGQKDVLSVTREQAGVWPRAALHPPCEATLQRPPSVRPCRARSPQPSAGDRGLSPPR